jgi:hypothetical protein
MFISRKRTERKFVKVLRDKNFTGAFWTRKKYTDAGTVNNIALPRRFWCPAKLIKPLPCPPVHVSSGISVMKEKRHKPITIILAGRRNTPGELFLSFIERKPADVMPRDKSIKYPARERETSGYPDHAEVITFQVPEIKMSITRILNSFTEKYFHAAAMNQRSSKGKA